LTIPLRLTDEQIKEIFDGKQSGDEILDFMDQKGYLTPIFKKGGNIHIKKENIGSFTSYCGGKVTEECIRRGKNSPNPLTRKRATFAGASRT
jgi:hypothetical protein